eukprot:3257700-Pyramimonas_sp.AAC.1
MQRERERKRGRRRGGRRTSVNQRGINDVGKSPPSMLRLHRPLQRFISIEGTASLKDNRWKTLQHAKTLLSESRRHGSTVRPDDR